MAKQNQPERNEIKRRKRVLINCNPSVCCRNCIITNDGIFVDLEVFKLECSHNCKMRSACGRVLSLLSQGKHKEALEVLTENKNQKKGI